LFQLNEKENDLKMPNAFMTSLYNKLALKNFWLIKILIKISSETTLTIKRTKFSITTTCKIKSKFFFGVDFIPILCYTSDLLGTTCLIRIFSRIKNFLHFFIHLFLDLFLTWFLLIFFHRFSHFCYLFILCYCFRLRLE
jgi:hypothetical protein